MFQGSKVDKSRNSEVLQGHPGQTGYKAMLIFKSCSVQINRIIKKNKTKLIVQHMSANS